MATTKQIDWDALSTFWFLDTRLESNGHIAYIRSNTERIQDPNFKPVGILVAIGNENFIVILSTNDVWHVLDRNMNRNYWFLDGKASLFVTHMVTKRLGELL